MRLFDAHSHWLPLKIVEQAHFFHPGWSDIEAQLKKMQELGIVKALLSYPTSDAHIKLGGLNELARIFNNEIAAVVKKYPDKFIGAAVLPIDNPQEILEELKRATEELGFRAVSLASSYDGVYLDDARFLPLYKEAQKLNLPIFVHSQIINPIGWERVKDPLLTPVIEYVFDTTICIGKLLMAGILRDYAVKFIFSYFGGVLPFLRERFDATYQMLRKMNFVKDLKDSPSLILKNIYVDTSGEKTLTNFLAALELFGPQHILWGSDYPAKQELNAAIEIVDKLNIPSQDKENIWYNNLQKLINSVKL